MAHSEDTGAAPDTEQLHDAATQAEQGLEQLATGLGQQGAPPETIQALTKMAEIVRTIASGLAKGMKEQAPEPAHTMDSAMAETMRERAAAQQGAAAPPQA